MRYLICSDVHSNWEALEAVLRAAEEEKPDRFLMLGDVVGYGPDPRDCLHSVRRNADVVLAGNHDYAAASLTDISYFNPLAQAAILWTRDRIQEVEVQYLTHLPLLYGIGGFFLSTPPPRTPSVGTISSPWRMHRRRSPSFRGRSVSWVIPTFPFSSWRMQRRGSR